MGVLLGFITKLRDLPRCLNVFAEKDQAPDFQMLDLEFKLLTDPGSAETNHQPLPGQLFI